MICCYGSPYASRIIGWRDLKMNIPNPRIIGFCSCWSNIYCLKDYLINLERNCLTKSNLQILLQSEINRLLMVMNLLKFEFCPNTKYLRTENSRRHFFVIFLLYQHPSLNTKILADFHLPWFSLSLSTKTETKDKSQKRQH